MSSIKVGLRFRPILKKENSSNVQWGVNRNLISSKNQKYQFSFGKLQVLNLFKAFNAFQK